MNLVELIPWAVFGACFCAAWGLFSFFNRRDTRADERLNALRNPSLATADRLYEGDDNIANVLEKAAPSLSKPLKSKDRLEQQQLKLRLAHAGFNSPHAPDIYLALKFASLLLGALMGSGVGLAAFGIAQRSLYSVAIGAGIGFYLPEVLLWFVAKRRQEKIFLTLPDTLDLLVIAVEIGQGVDAALNRVAQQVKNTAPDLCAELNLYGLQMHMGRARRDALHDLGVRAGVDDLNALASVLIQADRFGASIAQTLRDLSDSMRIKRRQLAEERAQKTAVKLIFPLVLFIFPGIFVVLVGPAAILMMNDMMKLN